MNLSFLASFVLPFLLAGSVEATCAASNAVCETGSGDCTSAVRIALQGDLVTAGNAAFYGKYCGGLNKCQVVVAESSSSSASEDTSMLTVDANSCEIDERHGRLLGKKKGKGKKKSKRSKHDSDDDETNEPCPALPCDEIDNSCSRHDSCLDNQLLITPPPPGERLQIPERCQCDVNLVYDMALEIRDNPAPTGLCDDAFYTEAIAPGFPVTGIQLLQHEGVFVAAPFCCSILLDLDGNDVPECAEDAKTDPQKAAVAIGFCKNLIDGLVAAQVFVCL